LVERPLTTGGAMRQWNLGIARAGLLALAVLAMLAIASAFGYRAYRQQLGARALAIRSPNGVQEGMYVKIGGIDQWIQIRGEDRENPVILFVHGGPGGSTIPISSGWQPWEKSFTVVQWDQRGAGRTFRSTGESIAATMTLAQMTQDGVELAEYLRAHLHKDGIVLVGHSWGSYLGIHMAKQRPDLFYAFVGTGQLVGRRSFEKQFELTVTRLKALAQAANNMRASRELAPISASADFSKMPCDTISFASPASSTPECDLVQKWAKALSLPSTAAFELRGPVLPPFMPDFSLVDWYYWWRGSLFSATQLRGRNGPMLQGDLLSLGTDFSIPMLFFEGTDDLVTPIEAARAYFEQIKAPQKQFVVFEGADHFLPLDRPDEFLVQLIEHVRPLAVAVKP
jgi:pimeloyl-ACP methyl ester carboxylesterase